MTSKNGNTPDVISKDVLRKMYAKKLTAAILHSLYTQAHLAMERDSIAQVATRGEDLNWSPTPQAKIGERKAQAEAAISRADELLEDITTLELADEEAIKRLRTAINKLKAGGGFMPKLFRQARYPVTGRDAKRLVLYSQVTRDDSRLGKAITRLVYECLMGAEWLEETAKAQDEHEKAVAAFEEARVNHSRELARLNITDLRQRAKELKLSGAGGTVALQKRIATHLAEQAVTVPPAPPVKLGVG